jgi:hypothetical protein
VGAVSKAHFHRFRKFSFITGGSSLLSRDIIRIEPNVNF